VSASDDAPLSPEVIRHLAKIMADREHRLATGVGWHPDGRTDGDVEHAQRMVPRLKAMDEADLAAYCAALRGAS